MEYIKKNFSPRLIVHRETKNYPFFNSFFESVIANLLLDNKNLNGNIELHFERIKKNKLIESGKINLKIQRGEFDLSESEFIIKNIGKIKVVSNKFYNNEGKINMQLYLNLFINNQEKLYKKFLISKKNRIDLKKLFCSVEINPSRKEIVVGDFEINDKDNESYNETTFAISSLQDLRKSINQLLINYEGWVIFLGLTIWSNFFFDKISPVFKDKI